MQIQTDQKLWSHAEWAALLTEATHLLKTTNCRVVATCLDNGPAFLALDVAAESWGRVHVPIPAFFTAAQVQHALQTAGVDLFIVPSAMALAWATAPTRHISFANEELALLELPNPPRALPDGTSKITFTSGTTAHPKGVCLSSSCMQAVAQSIVEVTRPLNLTRHLNALPYAVLLENIAGVLAPKRIDATLISLPLAHLGWRGASGLDIATFHQAVVTHQPNSLVILPQILQAWCAYLAQTKQRGPDSLRMVAVGGAPVGAPLVECAHQLGLPVYEGYGLSEGASVQTLNLPEATRAGSVGQVLPHARIRFAPDGEIEINGPLMLGYLGEASLQQAWWPTGDLGHQDADGYVYINGRKKNVIVTSYGRNVSPEWVETLLRSHPGVREAVVFGDGQPQLSAVIWTRDPNANGSSAMLAVELANTQLPDYAHVAHWVVADLAFSTDTGLATANGRPQRSKIFETYAASLMPPPTIESDLPMSFFNQLMGQTEASRNALLSTPIIQGCLAGEVSLESYLAFLQEAYHHVRHTVPLLAATRDALPPKHAWLVAPLNEYIEEEHGHEQWILNDIEACGGNRQAVIDSQPAHATEVMVAYAYDTIARGNPLGFLGMVHVLEGTSVSLALMAANAIQKPLNLPDAAFSYLRSHGTLDQEHTAHFAQLMGHIDSVQDQRAIVHAANAFYRLYGDVFKSLPLPQVAPLSAS